MNASRLPLDTTALSIANVVAVARHGMAVDLAPAARAAVERARAVIDARAGGKAAIYGVNTGFGSLSRHRIEPDAVREVQRNLIRSHAAGIGDPLLDEVVRAMLVILAASLARGCSGVRVELIEAIIALLNHSITPVVPSRGSVGASGDLAPLSHAALVLIGEGTARVDGCVVSGAEALAARGLEPVTLQAKEGLALINGTHMMCAVAALALHDLELITDAACRSAALAFDACRATDASLDARLHERRGQVGQIEVARRLREQLSGSKIINSHREDDPRVQDPYCLRATPQVLGAAMDTIAWTRSIVERELGAVTDNPLVLDAAEDGSGDIVSGGNFHGMPLAIALDTMSIAMCHVAGIAERRIFWLLAASDSENPVNVYLSPKPGLHSGLMIAQYTAAACCNELQTLATPASVANISTSAGIEDYNSMGATSAHQVRAGMELLESVIAIELLVMAEALEYQRPLTSGAGVEETYAIVRGVVPRLTEDRSVTGDVENLCALIRAGAFPEPERLP